jgi:hypothetical protein
MINFFQIKILNCTYGELSKMLFKTSVRCKFGGEKNLFLPYHILLNSYCQYCNQRAPPLSTLLHKQKPIKKTYKKTYKKNL